MLRHTFYGTGHQTNRWTTGLPTRVAYQAGHLLRLLELPPAERFDFAATGTAPDHVEELLATGQPLTGGDKSTLAQFAQMSAHWAMMNLRSYAIVMRIDQ